MHTGSEQRRSPRYPIQLPILHRLEVSGPTLAGVGWTRDLSEVGACVELPDLLRPHTSLRVRLRMDRGIVESEAQVVWESQVQVVWAGESGPAAGGVLHGITFTQIGPDHQRTLRELLSRDEKLLRPMLRVPVKVPVLCERQGQAGPPLSGWTSDISRAGLLLNLPEVVATGTVLKLVLQPADQPMIVEGMIVWVQPANRQSPGKAVQHGLRFTSPSWYSSLSLGLLLSVTH